MLEQNRAEELMRDMDFPASKEEIVDHVRAKQVDEEAMMFFESIPDLQYEKPEEVMDMIPESTEMTAMDEFGDVMETEQKEEGS